MAAETFYVSSNGSDSNSGTSPGVAWRTIDRANYHIANQGMRPGDNLLFRSGDRFPGSIVMDRVAGGTKEAPVVVGSFGSGPATILPGQGTGILVRESPWVTVSNLRFLAGDTSDGDGIRFDRIYSNGAYVPGVRIENCIARGFAWHGIMIENAQKERGFDGIQILRCETTGNRHAGIKIYGGNPSGRNYYAHRNLLIADCRAGNNPGDPSELNHHSGSGIMADGVEDGLIQHCLAWANGAECRSERGGPVGIWAHASHRLTIECCESFGNRSALRDGGGFDLDGGCSESTLRWNFSHDNYGPGFLIYTYNGAAYSDRGCKVTENVSWNDGHRGSGYSGIQVGSETGCHIRDLQIRNNTCISPTGSVCAVKIQGHQIEALIQSNLFVAAPFGVLASVSGYGHKLVFNDNIFWREDNKPVFLIDTQWPVHSLEQWIISNPNDDRIRSHHNEFLNPRTKLRLPKARKLETVRWPVAAHPVTLLVGAPALPPCQSMLDRSN